MKISGMEPTAGVRPAYPCDSCRKKKSRCVLPKLDAETCILCQFYGSACVFSSKKPPPRKKRSASIVKVSPDKRVRRQSSPQVVGHVPPGPNADKLKQDDQIENREKESPSNRNLGEAIASSLEDTSPPDSRSIGPPQPSVSFAHSKPNSWSVPPSVSPYELSLTFVEEEFSGWDPIFNLGDSLLESSDKSTQVVSLPDYDWLKESTLHKTLGLQCNRYLSHVGPSGELDSLLMGYYDYNERNHTELAIRKSSTDRNFETHSVIRKVREFPPATNSSTRGDIDAFLLLEEISLPSSGSVQDDKQIQLSPETVLEINQIQDLVGNLGPKLMDVFLRHVLPCYPMLYKTTLMDKFNRTIFELCPSILAIIYTFAINWWSYDKELSSKTINLSRDAMQRLAERYLAREIPKPTLSTVQAGLLILQQRIFYDHHQGHDDSWVLLSQTVSCSYEIGLHLDSTPWDIPRWEVSLRKRVAWSLYIQDKWGALTTGRPSLINDEQEWTVPDVSLNNDFVDMFSDEYKSANTDAVNPFTGAVLFVELIKLTKILSKILSSLHSAKKVTHRVDPNDSAAITQKIFEELEIVKKFHVSLKDWFQNVPSRLRMDSPRSKKGELSANCNIHLSFYAVEIALFRPLIKLLAVTNKNEFLEIKRNIFSHAFELFSHASESIRDLTIHHLQTFWYSFATANLATIATFGFLLFITAETDNQKQVCLDKIAEYRWSLALFSNAAPFFKPAIDRIDSYYVKLESEITKVNGKK